MNYIFTRKIPNLLSSPIFDCGGRPTNNALNEYLIKKEINVSTNIYTISLKKKNIHLSTFFYAKLQQKKLCAKDKNK